MYRDQHDRLRAQATKIAQATGAAEHRTLLAQLAGQLKMHLKAEDDALYPRLLTHADAGVRAKAKELQDSMGGIAAAFMAFYEKWIKTDAIAADLAAYRNEVGSFLDALARRMELEDRELYDLADRALAA